MSNNTKLNNNDNSAVVKLFDILEKFGHWVVAPKGERALEEAAIQSLFNTINEDESLDPIVKAATCCEVRKIVTAYRNKNNVVENAIKNIDKNAKPQNVDEDWFNSFFSYVSRVSDQGMQYIWGQILAGEINEPGTFSLSLLLTISVMNQKQAKVFCNLCKFCLIDDESTTVQPMVFIVKNQNFYRSQGISYRSLRELETLGLVTCEFEREYIFSNQKILRYGTEKISIQGDANSGDKIMIGNVLLTTAGQALYDIVWDEYKNYDSGIMDFIIRKLQKRNCRVNPVVGK